MRAAAWFRERKSPSPTSAPASRPTPSPATPGFTPSIRWRSEGIGSPPPCPASEHWSSRGLRVVSGEVLTIDVTLSVGDVAETVEVMATLPTIEKQSNKAGYARVNRGDRPSSNSDLPTTTAKRSRSCAPCRAWPTTPITPTKRRHEQGLHSRHAQCVPQLHH